MPPRSRSRFASIEALESRRLLSMAVAPLMHEFVVTKSAAKPAVVVNNSVGVATSSTSLSFSMGSGSPTAFGTPVSFTAIVTPTVGGMGTPTGNVIFTDNTTAMMLGQSPIVPGPTAIATFTTMANQLSLGTHAITATYSGDATYAAGNPSNTVTEVIGTGTTTTVMASATTIAPGAPGVQFTATVTPATGGGPAETGNVTFFDNGTTMLETDAVSNGMAVSSFIKTLAAGSHSITATYTGDANYITSTSVTPVAVTVSTPTTTMLAVTAGGMPAPANIVPSTMVTLTATVTPSIGGGPSFDGDVVTFMDNGASIGTAMTLNGVAILGPMTLSSGPNALIAFFSGDSNYRASPNSATTNITVAQISTSNTLLAQTPSVALGANAIFQATISPTPAAMGETVSFYDGTSLPASFLGTAPLMSGVATFNTSMLPQGSRTIYAVYNGDVDYTQSTSNNVTQMVGLVATVTITSPTAGSIPPSTPITLSASVMGTGPAPTGMVTFLDNGNSIGTDNLVAGVATQFNVTLPNGSNSLTASYTGDANYIPATTMSAVDVPVGFATSIVVSVPASAPLGSQVTLTANLTPIGAGGLLPTGMVTFYNNGVALAPTAPVAVGAGGPIAMLNLMTLPSGPDMITAQYGGDVNFAPNIVSNTATITIGTMAGVTPTITLTSSAPSGAGLGSPVTFTATIIGVGPAPTGTATFLANGVPFANAVPLVGGVAMATDSMLPSGPNLITVNYSGDAMYNAANSNPLTQVISATPSSPSTTTLTSSAAAAVLGNLLTFTAVVVPVGVGGVTPTGTVTFTSGMTTFGPVMLDPTGTAMLSTAALPVGMDSVTATYSGDLNYNSSVSTAVVETIGAGPAVIPNFSLLSSALSIPVGGTVTLTAALQPPVAGGATPTGTVTFFLNGLMGTNLGTQAVLANGTAVLTLTTLPQGVDSITAVYSGDSVYSGGNAGPLAINVGGNTGGMGNSLTLATSNPTVAVGTQVTFTATITPTTVGGVLPTGTITFYDNGMVIGNPVNVMFEMASIKVGNLPAGIDDITATYSGDVNYAASTSNLVVETVGTILQTQTFTNLVTSNPAVTIGGTALLTATVSTAGGTVIPTGVVSFIEGTATMGSAAVAPDGTATFSLPALKAGVDQIIATYNGALTFQASTSNLVIETVGPATPGSTTTTLSATTGTLSSAAIPDTFTAVIVPVISGGATPTGMVSFFDGPTLLGTSPVQSNGAATLTTTAPIVGLNNVTATYTGDTVYTASTSPAFTVAIGTITPTYTTALDVSTGSSAPAASVVFTATVVPSAVGTAAPSGDVTFLLGGVPIGTAPVQPDGTATFTSTTLVTGTNPVTAVYAGSTGVSGSSPVITEFVTSLPPSASLPAVSGETLPTGVVVAGMKTLIKLPVTITNTGQTIANGTFTLNIYFNAGTTLDGHEILAGTATKFLAINPTANTRPWKVILRSFPATMPGGTYHIIIQSIDPNGGAAATFTAGTIKVAAPVVTLSTTTSAVSPSSLQVGQDASIFVTVTNNGNISASGLLTIVLGLSSDGVTPLPAAKNTLNTDYEHTTIKPGDSKTFRVHFHPTAVVVAGNYYPYVIVTLDGFEATVIGTTRFTIN